MIHSMTGFGQARKSQEGKSYSIEIRSLNNRYFKASIKLPEPLARYENEIDKLLRSRLGRGSVTFGLRIREEMPTLSYEINTGALADCVRRLREAVNDDHAHIDLARLLDVPGIFQPPEIDEGVLQQQFEVIRVLSDQAIDMLIEMRQAEGKALLHDLQNQCADVERHLAAVQALSPTVVEEYHQRLRQRVAQLLSGVEGSNIDLDQDSLRREVALFAERCDINEEISRLRSHLKQFALLCESSEEAGRKLDFLTQEMLREANTIGSKANDAEIARHVVHIKAAIDRIKEQVQNVE